MFKNKTITLKILLFLVFIDFLETFTQFCFKKSVLSQVQLEIHNFTNVFVFIHAVIASPFLWVGFLSVLTTFIIWSGILSKIDLSVAVPVCSFSYITVPVVSMIFFHEKINALRWSGIIFIITGVILVSLSSKHKEKVAE